MSRLSSQLLKWYDKNKRILPWRDHPDAYAVWISEIMLQQTRVETVIPYFERWMEIFPSVYSLADASEQDVLNAWEGLGYYSRARNLLKAAKVIVREYGGELPRVPHQLMNLPGIGRYTAGAIASIAFGRDESALDGNLKRVYSRLYDLSEAVDSSQGEKKLWEFARKNLPKGQAGDFNQALMDLGAMICTPKNPRCLLCPLRTSCKAQKNGTQEMRPVKTTKKVTPHYVLASGLIVEGGKVLLAQRPSKGLLGGMWEFPNGHVEGDPAKEVTKALKKGYSLDVRRKEAMGIVQHAYTHFRVTVHAFRCELKGNSQTNLNWVAIENLGEYPMGKVDRQIARMIEPGNHS